MHPGDADRTGTDREGGISERIDGRPPGTDDGGTEEGTAGGGPDGGSVDADVTGDARTGQDDGAAGDAETARDVGGPADDGEAPPLEPIPGTGLDDRGSDLPYIFARRTVKADREALPVYVRSETEAGVEELERRLNRRFDRDDLMALDVREALVTVGLRNADEVAETLEAWGYGRR